MNWIDIIEDQRLQRNKAQLRFEDNKKVTAFWACAWSAMGIIVTLILAYLITDG